ncbi:MAG: 2-amino-4-hydroxy-6-hydroxymethyldihydropteridine diphosphokinase [Chitinophagaceae bacterium]|nr:MAG: 2-amino-4-hydroxy-6-hydroxymethyldihydropteridine diphosphokinase [Chitinophagaceae bacterium]
MCIAYLLIGGNIGNRPENLSEAVRLIGERAGRIRAVSGIFETAPWGLAEQDSFLNQAIAVDTELAAEALLQILLAIELDMGRRRQTKNGPRVIDIDILFYGNETISSKDLTIPHPLLAERRFALVPLCDLIPDFIHPVLKLKLSELLEICPDTLPVSLFKDSGS